MAQWLRTCLTAPPTPAYVSIPLASETVGRGVDGDSATAANTADTIVPFLAGTGGGGLKGTPGGNREESGEVSSPIVLSNAVAHETRRFNSLNSFAQGGVFASPMARPTLALRNSGGCTFRLCGLVCFRTGRVWLVGTFRVVLRLLCRIVGGIRVWFRSTGKRFWARSCCFVKGVSSECTSWSSLLYLIFDGNGTPIEGNGPQLTPRFCLGCRCTHRHLSGAGA